MAFLRWTAVANLQCIALCSPSRAKCRKLWQVAGEQSRMSALAAATCLLSLSQICSKVTVTRRIGLVTLDIHTRATRAYLSKRRKAVTCR